MRRRAILDCKEVCREREREGEREIKRVSVRSITLIESSLLLNHLYLLLPSASPTRKTQIQKKKKQPPVEQVNPRINKSDPYPKTLLPTVFGLMDLQI